ncbi:Imm1 family immunity protein [Saccharopolyspora shandongensis]|uniref:Imm1 family immunity protein n=1 Tax=Saccharopolyspora shandongensis TaxID=418495 RepID=UPI0033E18F81
MPANVEEIAAGVRAAIERLPHDSLTLAGECVDEAATQLHRLSLESNAPELSESVDDLGTSRENLDRGLQVLDRIREILELYLASIGVRPEVSPLPKPEFPAGGPPNRVKNLRGDHYPPEAASMATHLPKRVNPGVGERTVGVPRIGGRELPAMSSGRDETWSPAVSRRLREIGIRRPGQAWTFQLNPADVRAPRLTVGLNADRGFVLWEHGVEALRSTGGTNTEWADYWRGGHHFQMDPGSEIPAPFVFAALGEFLATRERPTCIDWIEEP